MSDAKKKPTPAPALVSMTREGFAKIMRELKDEHDAADEAAMSVASAYKAVKKRGINLEALRLVRKLSTLDNPAKIQSFLADFDRLRELAGFDDQQQLFEDDKTKPQKDAAADKVVDIKTAKTSGGAEKVAKSDQKPKKTKETTASPAAPNLEKNAASWGNAAKTAPVVKAKLFDSDDGDSDIEEIEAEAKARQAGFISGHLGEDYHNPHPEGHALREPWHAGWVAGTEQLSAETANHQQSA